MQAGYVGEDVESILYKLLSVYLTFYLLNLCKFSLLFLSLGVALSIHLVPFCRGSVSPVLIWVNLCLIVPLLYIIRYMYFLDGGRRLPTIITVLQNKCLYEAKEIISVRKQQWNSSKNLLARNRIFGNYGFWC